MASAADAPPPGVVVAAATRVGFPLTVEALGTARANEAIEIRAQITETVTRIRFEEGQDVETGAALIELENTESLARLAAVKAALADSDAQYRRARDLLAKQLIPSSDLETLAARREADQAAVAAASARLADTVIRAPFAGRLGLRRVSIGSYVTPGTVITTLDDTSSVKVDFDVPETALGRLAVGLEVTAHSAAWPEQSFVGTVRSIDTRVDPVSRTLTVRALIPNPDRRLRAGMFLTVLVLREETTALVVPEQAIVPEQSRQYVLVVGADGVVDKRAVQIGRRRPGQTEIADGLAEGELVIVEGTLKVRDGGRVAIQRTVTVGP